MNTDSDEIYSFFTGEGTVAGDWRLHRSFPRRVGRAAAIFMGIEAILNADVRGSRSSVRGQQFQHGLVIGRPGEKVSLYHLAIELPE